MAKCRIDRSDRPGLQAISANKPHHAATADLMQWTDANAHPLAWPHPLAWASVSRPGLAWRRPVRGDAVKALGQVSGCRGRVQSPSRFHG